MDAWKGNEIENMWPKVKNILHTARTVKRCVYEFKEFLSENRGEVEQRNTPYSVRLKNGEVHWFVPESLFPKWCLGRTYYDAEGNKYHSGTREE